MSQAIIRLENVSFESGQGSLREITLSIYPKETYILTGPIGAGKTVLLKLCLGLLQPQKGEVYIGENNFTTATYHQLIKYRHNGQISYMAYPPALISNQSVCENILLPLEYHSPKDRNILKKAEAVINLLGLAGHEHKMPFELSTEEKRRVELARALITQPQIIFYNQPLEGFDGPGQQELVQIIKGTGCTNIIATNNWRQFMPIADRIGVLKSGKLLYSGPPEGLGESGIGNCELRI